MLSCWEWGEGGVKVDKSTWPPTGSRYCTWHRKKSIFECPPLTKKDRNWVCWVVDSRASSLKVLGEVSGSQQRMMEVSKRLDLGPSHSAWTMRRTELVPTYWDWAALLVMAHGQESCLQMTHSMSYPGELSQPCVRTGCLICD